MPPRKRGFFAEPSRPEDELARQQEVEALLAPRRTVVQDLAIARIRPNPYQARKEFTGLDELAEAIRQQGFVSRLRVRQDPGAPGYFQLVYGERRLRAAALAGLEAVPVEIADHSDAELIEIGLAENIQRRDLGPLEEADVFQRLIRDQGYSIRRLAERIGKDKSYVEDRLKLLEAPADVRQMVEQRPDSLRAAREIAKVEDATSRAALIQGVVKGTLSTEGVRGAVKGLGGTGDQANHEAARRQIAGDVQTVLRITARWGALLDESNEAHGLVEPALGKVVVALERIAERLKSRQS
jgi:ParB family chromosome partitioning protein